MTNNTADLAPATPALGAPADGSFIDSTTPTLSATFSDPDPSDTGKVTFEVCPRATARARSARSSRPRSRTAPTAAPRCPAAFNLQTATTYYWRAKNVDGLNATSSFSATQLVQRRHDGADPRRRRPRSGHRRRIPVLRRLGEDTLAQRRPGRLVQAHRDRGDAQSGVASVGFPAIFGTGSGTPGTERAAPTSRRRTPSTAR